MKPSIDRLRIFLRPRAKASLGRVAAIALVAGIAAGCVTSAYSPMINYLKRIKMNI